MSTHFITTITAEKNYSFQLQNLVLIFFSFFFVNISLCSKQSFTDHQYIPLPWKQFKSYIHACPKLLK